MEKNLKGLIPTLAISTALVTIGLLADNLSVVLLFALVPVFIILKDSIANGDTPIKYGLALALSLSIGPMLGFLVTGNSFDFYLFIYPLGVALTTSLYWLVQKNLNSNLGLVTFVIYWLAFEYFALLINPELGNYFVFGALSKLPVINFSHFTGFLGYTLWALASNLILSFVLYDANGPFKIKLRILSLVYAAIIITSPLWLSLIWNIDGDNISRQLMIDNYSGLPLENTDYLEKGEWLGRTSAWVAVLLTIYALVKKKITK
ncbi:hypothetical protein [Fulvivirga lutimaris]|uniref:hypothetical protein n=1 Tax=Fulvivirga lutimaris TaxID=1819566 RepID=UPI0012BD6C76|nr:hypothetical protein [Fulvivirga lutimaris]MTI40364.1 hypothetical protein [Fulvivirga lutimaris]